jgi:enoyl-[acyl-carrier protein] reductase II
MAERWSLPSSITVTGHEAAAHGGDVTSLVLIPSIVDTVKIPVIAAGGFADGRGLAAALALGAEGIAMGTRFMTTKESPLHEFFKQLSIEKDITDTLYSERFDGLHCRVLDTPAARKAIRKGLDLPASFFTSQDIARQLRLPYAKLFAGVVASGWKNAKQLAFMANAFKAIRIATENGDNEKGVLTVGQVTGLVRDIPTVAELMERIVAEAAAVRERLNTAIAGS